MQDFIEMLTDIRPDIDFETQTGLIDKGLLNSFDIVTIIAEVDDNFGVTIPAEEILPENFNSAESLYALVERLSNGI